MPIPPVTRTRLARSLFVIGAAFCAGSFAPRVPACDLQVDPLGPRYRIPFFEYGGATDGEARNQSSRFRAVMNDKVISWAEELQGLDANRAPGHKALPELELVPSGADTLSSLAAIRQYWTSSHSLELFKGLLEPSTPPVYTVRSRIFLGELGAPLQTESILVSMPISGAEMASTMDAHSIVTYFALALDLKRRHCDSATIIGVLDLIRAKFTDLKRRGPLDPVLLPVEQAADRLLAEAKQKP